MELAFQHPAIPPEIHPPGEVAVDHRGQRAADVADRLGEVRNEIVDGSDRVGPAAARTPERGSILELTVAADGRRDPLELGGHALVVASDRVERLRDLAEHAARLLAESDREVARFQKPQRTEQLEQLRFG